MHGLHFDPRCSFLGPVLCFLCVYGVWGGMLYFRVLLCLICRLPLFTMSFLCRYPADFLLVMAAFLVVVTILRAFAPPFSPGIRLPVSLFRLY